MKLQEEKARAESAKYKVGKSTSLQVAQVQRDLIASQISASESIASYRKAIVELYRTEGILLTMLGINIPEIESSN